ncbi:hypothetical protein BE20_04710 [Sorangium cellulosum]|nr:hypothetical protein BE20_04710 [Sorangium cellulosum]
MFVCVEFGVLTQLSSTPSASSSSSQASPCTSPLGRAASVFRGVDVVRAVVARVEHAVVVVVVVACVAEGVGVAIFLTWIVDGSAVVLCVQDSIGV